MKQYFGKIKGTLMPGGSEASFQPQDRSVPIDWRKTLFCIIASLALLFPSQAVQADDDDDDDNGGGSAVATTNVSIKLPNCIILHYYSGLTINFEQFSSAIDEGSADFAVQFTGEAQSQNDIGVESREISIPSRVSLNLPNVWAIRGLSPSGNAKVSITVTKSELVSGTSRITIAQGSNGILIEDNYGHSGTNINTSLNGIGTTEATVGNVRMTLDFSRTTRAGLHTGGQYKITAETI